VTTFENQLVTISLLDLKSCASVENASFSSQDAMRKGSRWSGDGKTIAAIFICLESQDYVVPRVSVRLIVDIFCGVVEAKFNLWSFVSQHGLVRFRYDLPRRASGVVMRTVIWIAGPFDIGARGLLEMVKKILAINVN